MNKEEFINELKKINIEIDENKLNKLDLYYNMLISYNKKINLTAIEKEEEVYLKHFYDSLTLIKEIDLNKKILLCDIGTGAGFPGIVLKIVFPNINMTLVDALDKRIQFLNLVIEKLKLTEIKTIHSRIEDLKEVEKYDVVVSRAVAKTNILLELGCKLPKINGLFILMKGNVEEELETARPAISVLGYIIEKINNFKLPIENSRRTILVLKKIKKSEKIYPREFSKIKKKPL